MEYYILNLYQNEKSKCAEVEPGFNRFGSKVKKIVIACITIMCVSTIVTVAVMLVFPKQLWFLIGVAVCFAALFILLLIGNNDRKKNMDKYVNSHMKKIEILENVLSKASQLNSKEKIEELIGMYEVVIDKKKQEEKMRNRLIVVISSALAGILSISFQNLEVMDISFNDWIDLAESVIMIAVLACICTHSFTYFDSIKYKYERMINDLRDLLLIKY